MSVSPKKHETRDRLVPKPQRGNPLSGRSASLRFASRGATSRRRGALKRTFPRGSVGTRTNPFLAFRISLLQRYRRYARSPRCLSRSVSRKYQHGSVSHLPIGNRRPIAAIFPVVSRRILAASEHPGTAARRGINASTSRVQHSSDREPTLTGGHGKPIKIGAARNTPSLRIVTTVKCDRLLVALPSKRTDFSSTPDRIR